MISLPRIKSYKGHPNANAMRFELGDLTIWFSYETPVAFHTLQTGLVVRKNEWGPTTGKHLNMIEAQAGARLEAPSDRVSGDEFRKLFQQHAAPAFASVA